MNVSLVIFGVFLASSWVQAEVKEEKPPLKPQIRDKRKSNVYLEIDLNEDGKHGDGPKIITIKEHQIAHLLRDLRSICEKVSSLGPHPSHLVEAPQRHKTHESHQHGHSFPMEHRSDAFVNDDENSYPQDFAHPPKSPRMPPFRPSFDDYKPDSSAPQGQLKLLNLLKRDGFVCSSFPGSCHRASHDEDFVALQKRQGKSRNETARFDDEIFAEKQEPEKFSFDLPSIAPKKGSSPSKREGSYAPENIQSTIELLEKYESRFKEKRDAKKGESSMLHPISIEFRGLKPKLHRRWIHKP